MKGVRPFTHINAKTIDEALAAFANGEAAVVAGGTDLLSMMRFEVLRDDMYPRTLINLKTVAPGFSYIKKEAGILKIGVLLSNLL